VQTIPTVTADGGRAAAVRWLGALGTALEAGDAAGASELFVPDGYLRDILALTWDLRTFSGLPAIRGALAAALSHRRFSDFELVGSPSMFQRRRWGWTIEGIFSFETDLSVCRGYLRLLADEQDPSVWKAWTLLTTMEDLKGHEEKVGSRRPAFSAPHTPGASGELGDPEAQRAEGDPEALVIGAGQAGLAVAARLRQLGVATLVVEREGRVGDNWRNRYQSLVLHNQVWANHLPYLPFPSTWPVYISKDGLGDWLEHYASILSIPVWTSTQVLDSRYDPSSGAWEVTVARSDGSSYTLRPNHVVLATGVFGVPRRPVIAGSARFDGRILHATEYHGGRSMDGHRVLVIGSGSSAHDVAQDLQQQGADVTMLQRSSTCVVSVDPGATRAYAIYREDGAPVEDCDLVTNSFPFPLLAEMHKEMTERIAELDADLLDGLRSTGFATDFGEDGSGFLMKFFRHGGGYYINVGASELIVSGKIKVKQGAEVARLDRGSAYFTDGTSLDVDMVVVATGYENMQESVRALFGDTVAERVGPVWGLDDEGEQRSIWKRTGQPGLWIAGGSLQQCRPYSKYLALQIKGALEELVL
jgi:cation diffusion facilitator CzcD-associated flavoprotein CzcO